MYSMMTRYATAALGDESDQPVETRVAPKQSQATSRRSRGRKIADYRGIDTHKAGHISVKTNNAVSFKVPGSLALILKVFVQLRAVSREMYKVGAKKRTAKTQSGTMAAGVPSL